MSIPNVRLKPTALGLFHYSHRIFVWAIVASAMGQAQYDRYPVVIEGKVGFIDRASIRQRER
jgi:hypothetical protein